MKKSHIVKTAFAALILSAAFNASATEQDRDTSNHDGGLMKQMMNEQFQVKTIHDQAVQQHLSSINLGDTNGGSNH
jgi:hypothetical protein